MILEVTPQERMSVINRGVEFLTPKVLKHYPCLTEFLKSLLLYIVVEYVSGIDSLALLEIPLPGLVLFPWFPSFVRFWPKQTKFSFSPRNILKCTLKFPTLLEEKYKLNNGISTRRWGSNPKFRRRRMQQVCSLLVLIYYYKILVTTCSFKLWHRTDDFSFCQAGI